MLRIFLVILSLIVFLFSQTTLTAPSPQLIVVISLDQFRYDYLTRFREHFGDGGFKFLLEKGANFANATYKHALNMTGPGHAVISTGCYGNQNGIFANNWFDPATRQDVYCVGDKNARPIGSVYGAASPSNLMMTTFGDELRLSSNFRSKVISISNKDRAAVLMGGKLANGVYWMMDSVFMTSNHYMDRLPQWVEGFNSSGLMNSYFGKKWEKSLSEEAYAMMDMDDAPYEGSSNGLGRTFPHRITGDDTARITRSYYYALLTTPYGSEVLAAFAKEAIKAEELGKRGVTDLFCIGFSSTDYVGHTFGPHSQEVLDMAVRMDKILADLFAFLHAEIGLSNCLVVLTSDHGVAPIPEYVLAHHQNAPAGREMQEELLNFCSAALTKKFGKLRKEDSWIDRIVDNNVYLNRTVIARKKLMVDEVATVLAGSLRERKEVATAFSHRAMAELFPSTPVEHRMKRSFHRERSGDVFYALKPLFIEGYATTGTTHGEPYDYDAHVPVIIFGGGIRPGTYATEASPADIAPTLSALLGISFPAGREGMVLEEALK